MKYCMNFKIGICHENPQQVSVIYRIKTPLCFIHLSKNLFF